MIFSGFTSRCTSPAECSPYSSEYSKVAGITMNGALVDWKQHLSLYMFERAKGNDLMLGLEGVELRILVLLEEVLRLDLQGVKGLLPAEVEIYRSE